MAANRYLQVFAVLAILGALGAGLTWADEAAAKVNGETITEAELIEELMSRHGYAVLETMIEALAIRQKAEERGISVTTEQIEARYQQARRDIIAAAPPSQLSEAQVFAMWLARRSLNHETFREEVELQLLLEGMVKDQVKVTAREVAEYYESHRQQLERPEAVRVCHITVTTKEEAERVRQEILDGQISFADAAREYSIDPYGRDNAGLLPWLGRGELPKAAWEPVREQAFKLKADGEISLVFQTALGWDILRREAYQKGGTPPFEEIEEDLAAGLLKARLARAAQEMRTAIARLAKIERFVEFPSASGSAAEPEPDS